MGVKKGNLNKEINKVIRERLANGETKADIFKYLQTQFNNADISARLLAVSPYPEQCQKCRNLNYVLIAILVVIAIVKVLSAGLFILSEIPKAIPLLLIVPLINIYIIYLVAKFNIAGYCIIVLFSVLALGDVVVGLCDTMAGVTDDTSPVVIIIIAVMFLVMFLLVLAAMVFAVVQCRRLLPNTTFFLRPKKNEAGEYIF